MHDAPIISQIINMINKKTEITKQDLEDYFKTLSNQCLIRKVRSKIFNNMRYALKSEFRKRENDIVLVDEANGVYKIVAKDASDRLQDYLNQFSFVLKD